MKKKKQRKVYCSDCDNFYWHTYGTADTVIDTVPRCKEDIIPSHKPVRCDFFKKKKR